MQLATLVGVGVLLLGCGAGHRRLTAINVSPRGAASNVSTRDTIQYTATGKFDDNSTRTLTVADGLSWKSSNISVATYQRQRKCHLLSSSSPDVQKASKPH